MITVNRWTGFEAKLLREACRLSIRDFAAHLGVGVRTVNKWEARQSSIMLLPYMQEILDTAFAQASDETRARFVSMAYGDSPDYQIPAESPGTGSSDVVTAYPMRGHISRPKWNGTIRGCKKNLWLYGMAELGYALDDEVPSILEEAVKVGCDIRILLLDPDYRGIFDIDADEGNPFGTLASRIRSALARFQQIRKACAKQMQIRVYSAPPTVSIVRGDDRMLVTPYLRFFVGSNSPSFELHHTGEMFDRYTRHFQSTWNLAKDCVE
ncbi:MAG: DUF5919 domain-containing protein [Pseudonocardiaceae bacterium]